MATRSGHANGDGPRTEFPEFDLGARPDEEGERVTVFPDEPDDVATEWLTIDAGVVVPIEETV